MSHVALGEKSLPTPGLEVGQGMARVSASVKAMAETVAKL